MKLEENKRKFLDSFKETVNLVGESIISGVQYEHHIENLFKEFADYDKLDVLVKESIEQIRFDELNEAIAPPNPTSTPSTPSPSNEPKTEELEEIFPDPLENQLDILKNVVDQYVEKLWQNHLKRQMGTKNQTVSWNYHLLSKSFAKMFVDKVRKYFSNKTNADKLKDVQGKTDYRFFNPNEFLDINDISKKYHKKLKPNQVKPFYNFLVSNSDDKKIKASVLANFLKKNNIQLENYSNFVESLLLMHERKISPTWYLENTQACIDFWGFSVQEATSYVHETIKTNHYKINEEDERHVLFGKNSDANVANMAQSFGNAINKVPQISQEIKNYIHSIVDYITKNPKSIISKVYNRNRTKQTIRNDFSDISDADYKLEVAHKILFKLVGDMGIEVADDFSKLSADEQNSLISKIGKKIQSMPKDEKSRLVKVFSDIGLNDPENEGQEDTEELRDWGMSLMNWGRNNIAKTSLIGSGVVLLITGLIMYNALNKVPQVHVAKQVAAIQQIDSMSGDGSTGGGDPTTNTGPVLKNAGDVQDHLGKMLGGGGKGGGEIKNPTKPTVEKDTNKGVIKGPSQDTEKSDSQSPPVEDMKAKAAAQAKMVKNASTVHNKSGFLGVKHLKLKLGSGAPDAKSYVVDDRTGKSIGEWDGKDKLIDKINKGVEKGYVFDPDTYSFHADGSSNSIPAHKFNPDKQVDTPKEKAPKLKPSEELQKKLVADEEARKAAAGNTSQEDKPVDAGPEPTEKDFVGSMQNGDLKGFAEKFAKNHPDKVQQIKNGPIFKSYMDGSFSQEQIKQLAASGMLPDLASIAMHGTGELPSSDAVVKLQQKINNDRSTALPDLMAKYLAQQDKFQDAKGQAFTIDLVKGYLKALGGAEKLNKAEINYLADAKFPVGADNLEKIRQAHNLNYDQDTLKKINNNSGFSNMVAAKAAQAKASVKSAFDWAKNFVVDSGEDVRNLDNVLDALSSAPTDVTNDQGMQISFGDGSQLQKTIIDRTEGLNNDTIKQKAAWEFNDGKLYKLAAEAEKKPNHFEKSTLDLLKSYKAAVDNKIKPSYTPNQPDTSYEGIQNFNKLPANEKIEKLQSGEHPLNQNDVIKVLGTNGVDFVQSSGGEEAYKVVNSQSADQEEERQQNISDLVKDTNKNWEYVGPGSVVNQDGKNINFEIFKAKALTPEAPQDSSVYDDVAKGAQAWAQKYANIKTIPTAEELQQGLKHVFETDTETAENDAGYLGTLLSMHQEDSLLKPLTQNIIDAAGGVDNIKDSVAIQLLAHGDLDDSQIQGLAKNSDNFKADTRAWLQSKLKESTENKFISDFKTFMEYTGMDIRFQSRH
jgi:hypothetical protein